MFTRLIVLFLTHIKYFPARYVGLRLNYEIYSIYHVMVYKALHNTQGPLALDPI